MNSNQQDQKRNNGDRGRLVASWNEIQIHGIKPNQLKWIVGAASFTIVMLGIRFAAQAIADILNAIKP